MIQEEMGTSACMLELKEGIAQVKDVPSTYMYELRKVE